jgi:hypothetical protein
MVAEGEEVVRDSPDPLPVPTNATVVGPLAALLETKRVALSVPEREGLKTILRRQLCWEASEVLHVVVSVKSFGLAPEIPKVSVVSGAAPELVRVIV